MRTRGVCEHTRIREAKGKAKRDKMTESGVPDVSAGIGGSEGADVTSSAAQDTGTGSGAGHAPCPQIYMGGASRSQIRMPIIFSVRRGSIADRPVHDACPERQTAGHDHTVKHQTPHGMTVPRSLLILL